MNIKHMMLGVSLVAIATAGYATNNDEQMQKLIAERNEKEYELQALGKKIAEQEEVISCLTKRMRNFGQEWIELKKNEIRQKNKSQYWFHLEPSKEEITKIIDLVSKEAHDFKKRFMSNIQSKERLKNMMLDTFLEHFAEGINHDFAPAMLKFYVIRCAFETVLLTHLFEQWEHCASELGTINNQLVILENTSLNKE